MQTICRDSLKYVPEKTAKSFSFEIYHLSKLLLSLRVVALQVRLKFFLHCNYVRIKVQMPYVFQSRERVRVFDGDIDLQSGFGRKRRTGRLLDVEPEAVFVRFRSQAFDGI